MNTTGTQMPLFSPSAEAYASVRILMGTPGVARANSGRRQRHSQVKHSWRPISLADMTPQEVAAAPGTFQELCRATSVHEAIKLCEQLGGLKLRIPPPEDGNRWKNTELRLQLKALLSKESYERLLLEMGRSGSEVTFPRLDKLKKQPD